MACTIISGEGAVFVLWGKLTQPDIDTVLERVQLAEKAYGNPIVYITRVPTDAPPPESELRQRLNDAMPAMRALCVSYHVILEGEGFLSAIKRAILAGLMQFGWPRNTFFVHASSGEVVFKAPMEARARVEAILHMAERQGLLSARAPTAPQRSALGRVNV